MPSEGIQAPVKKQKMTTKPAIVSIEGIIGSGKSEILDWIEDRYKSSNDVVVVREPSDTWENIQINGKNLLDLYYLNRCEHGFAFQVLYFLAVERKLRKAILDHADKRVLICERSLLSARNVYYNSMEGSYQGEIQAQVYKKLFEKEGVGYLYPDQMILLDKPPNLCLGRISRKDWKNDEVITERYLEESRAAHKELRGQSTSGGFLEFCGNMNIEQMAESIERLIEDQKQRLIGDDVVLHFPKLVSLEGNVGAGKSTLLDEIQEIIDQQGISSIRIMKEPVDEWLAIRQSKVSETDSDHGSGRHSILDWFYCDPAKYAMVFQTLVCWSTMMNLRREVKEHPEVQIILCERSLWSSKLVFGRMLYEEGYLDEAEYKVLEYLLEEEGTEWMYPNHSFYLETDAKTCLDRIRQRERKGEENINIDWLERCQEYHERMWDETKMTVKKIPQNMVADDGTAVNRAKLILNWCEELKETCVALERISMTIEEKPLTDKDESEERYDVPVDEGVEGSEENDLDETLLVRIKHRAICHMTSVRRSEINYKWLKEITKENFPMENNKDFCFGWKRHNQEEGYISDEEDLSNSIKEMKNHGQAILKYEVVTTKSSVIAARINSVLKEQRRL